MPMFSVASKPRAQSPNAEKLTPEWRLIELKS